MKKKLLKIATTLTIMGGVALSTENTVVKAQGNLKNRQASSIVFTDVPKGHWSSEAIQELSDWGIITGYGNGIFGFGDNVTREQVAALIYRAFEVEEQDEYENPYGDIVDGNSTMFLEEILALTELGIFTGDEHKNFRPKDTLTRAEMAQIITRAFELEVKGIPGFKDVPKSFWAYNAINAVGSNGIAQGVGEGNFAPNMKVTREQYAQFLYKAILQSNFQ
ncbi:S-layer homology domain-containing protein [Bacillus cereus]|nr:S-layer homology domain-containing protein [Bacillus cereus]